jgi:hypothetical protein
MNRVPNDKKSKEALDLFDNSVSYQTSSPLFQANALQKYFAVVA